MTAPARMGWRGGWSRLAEAVLAGEQTEDEMLIGYIEYFVPIEEAGVAATE